MLIALDVWRCRWTHGPSPAHCLYTVQEAADTLKLGVSTLYALMAEGAVSSVRIGRARRIPYQALEAFLIGLQGAEIGERSSCPRCGSLGQADG